MSDEFCVEEWHKKMIKLKRAAKRAKALLKRGDRVCVTNCPGTKRTFTFECWSSDWMVSRKGLVYHPTCAVKVNGVEVNFNRPPTKPKSPCL